ncbi:CHASE2 domain-containing protein [Desulfoplanes sp. PS50]
MMASLVPQPRIIAFLENKSLDLRMELRGVQRPPGSVVIALIDEKSIEALGRWPWSREILAVLVDTLREAQVKVLGFDVLFAESEVKPATTVVDDLINEYMQQVLLTDNPESQMFFDRLMQARALSDPDQVFASSLQQFGKVVLAMAFVDTATTHGHCSGPPETLLASAYGSSTYEQKSPLQPRSYPYTILPIPRLAHSSKYLGFVNTLIDDDGFIRKERMVIAHDGLFYAPLALKICQEYLGISQEDLILDNREIVCGDKRVGLTRKGFAYLNFYGPSGTIDSYSVIDILEKKIAPEMLREKIVLIGGAAAGMEDLWATVFDPTFRGVEKQATVVENMLHDDFFVHAKWNALFIDCSLIVVAMLVFWAIYALRPMYHFLVCISLVGISFLSVYYFFVTHNMIVDYTYTFLAIIGTYLLLTTYRFLSEEQSRRFLHATFSSYISEDVINDLYKNNKKPELGGEQRDITAFFTDIEDFTVFSEILSPRQLVELLNEYYSEMTDILISEKGCLDKYEGDAIVAFFGAPHNLPDHAYKAVCTAVKMQKKLKKLREKWKQEYDLTYCDRNTKQVCENRWHENYKWPFCVHEMSMRIGINSGEIVVGNVGSSTRMNYTMMGDAVNLAARLESLCKEYGVCILASEHTMHAPLRDGNGVEKQVKDMFYVRMLDHVVVVGMSRPVAIYEVIDFYSQKNLQIEHMIVWFNRGFKEYTARNWDAALAAFGQAFEIEKQLYDSHCPSKVFMDRCVSFKKNPPDSAWKGVHVHTNK